MGRAYAIDIGAGALKAVAVEASAAKVKLLRATFIPRELADPEARPESMAQGLDAAAAALAEYTGAGVVGFPSEAYSMRFMASPTAEPQKVATLVKVMAGEKLKDAEDQPLVTAHGVLPRVSTSKDDLLVMTLAATDATVLGSHAELAPLGVTAQEIAPQAVGLFFLARAAGLLNEETNAMIVDLGTDWMSLVLVMGGEFIFARTMLGGSRRITQALAKRQGDGYAAAERFKLERAELKPMSKDMEKSELAVNSALRESADSLAGLLTQALNLAKRELSLPKFNPQTVLLTGGGANLKGLCDHLAKKMTKEVALIDLSGLSIDALDGESQELVRQGYFSTAIGMAIGKAQNDPLALGLTSLAVQKKKQFMQTTVWALAAAPLFVIAFVLLWWQSSSQATVQANAEKAWQAAEKNLASTRTKLDDKLADLKQVTDLRDAYVGKDMWGRRFVDLFAMLHHDQVHFGDDKAFQIVAIQPRQMMSVNGDLGGGDSEDQNIVDVVVQYDEASPAFTAQSGPQQQMDAVTKMIEQNPAYHTSLISPEKTGSDQKSRQYHWRLSVKMDLRPDDQITKPVTAANGSAAPASSGTPGAPPTPGTPATPGTSAAPGAPAAPAAPGG
ncbi:MAG: pilus assembly protein PilM, partial [Planctomycetota bacterium]